MFSLFLSYGMLLIKRVLKTSTLYSPLLYGQYYIEFYGLYNGTSEIRIAFKNETDYVINKMIKQIIVILKF